MKRERDDSSAIFAERARRRKIGSRRRWRRTAYVIGLLAVIAISIILVDPPKPGESEDHLGRLSYSVPGRAMYIETPVPKVLDVSTWRYQVLQPDEFIGIRHNGITSRGDNSTGVSMFHTGDPKFACVHNNKDPKRIAGYKSQGFKVLYPGNVAINEENGSRYACGELLDMAGAQPTDDQRAPGSTFQDQRTGRTYACAKNYRHPENGLMACITIPSIDR